MAEFAYTAKTAPKQTVSGTIEAQSLAAVTEHLRAKGLFPVQIEPKSGTDRGTDIVKFFGFKRIGAGALTQFTCQLADLLDAGVPLSRALKLLQHQASGPGLRQVIEGVNESVRRGMSLSGALTSYPRVFAPAYISMVKAGEEAGTLGDILRRLAKSLDDEHQLRSKLKAALVYPVFLGCVGLSTLIVLLVWVIPKFSSFFASLDQQLPLPTKLVIKLGAALAGAWPFLLVLSIVIILFACRMLKNKAVKLIFDKLCLHFPVLGALIVKCQLAVFMRTLGTLLSHGVSMLRALSIAGDTVSNLCIAEQVHRAVGRVAKGEKLHRCFGGGSIFSETLVGMMAIGEESGALPQMLVRLSSQYEQETERQIRTLTNMIEPVIIVVMGGVVGFIVISMLMPIFKVSTLVQ
jgi:type II secretory pathway component PulF